MGERMNAGVLPGTVDLVILRALADGPLHGFGISRRLRERSEGVVELQDAALYQALHRRAVPADPVLFQVHGNIGVL